MDDRYEDPAVDEEFFPGTPSNYFWSSSSYAPHAVRAWYVTFGYGGVDNVVKDDYSYVRCSRRGP